MIPIISLELIVEIHDNVIDISGGAMSWILDVWQVHWHE